MNKVPSYKDLVDDATASLYEVSDSPRIDAEVLLQHVLNRPLAWLISHGDSIPTGGQIKAFYQCLAKRVTGTPIAYIVGHKEFWTLDLLVTPDVLIPRGDTEILVEAALNKMPANQTVRVLDLGTGSGAIALAIAKERPASLVTATDSCPAALNIARTNAERHALTNLQFIQSDWFSHIRLDQKYDFIVSNPPYIAKDDQHLSQGDLRFEPSQALTDGKNGLKSLELISSNSQQHLKPGGWLWLEHGCGQAFAVSSMLHSNGFKNIEVYQDLGGRDRCTQAQAT